MGAVSGDVVLSRALTSQGLSLLSRSHEEQARQSRARPRVNPNEKRRGKQQEHEKEKETKEKKGHQKKMPTCGKKNRKFGRAYFKPSCHDEVWPRIIWYDGRHSAPVQCLRRRDVIFLAVFVSREVEQTREKFIIKTR